MPSFQRYSLEGIVIRRQNTRESDKIITIFSKSLGKVRVMARGVRKITSRRAGHIEVFKHIKVIVHTGHNIDILTEAATVSSYNSLRKNLVNVSYAYYLCELVDKLTVERQPHPEILDMLIKTLKIISQSRNITECEKIIYKSADFLLKTLGFLPPGKSLSNDTYLRFIESIIERKLLSPNIIKKIQT